MENSNKFKKQEVEDALTRPNVSLIILAFSIIPHDMKPPSSPTNSEANAPTFLTERSQ